MKYPALGLELVGEEAVWLAPFPCTHPLPFLSPLAPVTPRGSPGRPPGRLGLPTWVSQWLVGAEDSTGTCPPLSPMWSAQQGWLSLPRSAWICQRVLRTMRLEGPSEGISPLVLQMKNLTPLERPEQGYAVS